jgi:hypothetical protein
MSNSLRVLFVGNTTITEETLDANGFFTTIRKLQVKNSVTENPFSLYLYVSCSLVFGRISHGPFLFFYIKPSDIFRKPLKLY